MRFILLLKSSAPTEAGEVADAPRLAAMRAYNLRLRQAGVLLGGEFLSASSEGARVTFGAEGPDAAMGPFDHPETLVAGFWVFKCDSLEDAMDWAAQAPLPVGGEIEIRPLVTLGPNGQVIAPKA